MPTITTANSIATLSSDSEKSYQNYSGSGQHRGHSFELLRSLSTVSDDSMIAGNRTHSVSDHDMLSDDNSEDDGSEVDILGDSKGYMT